MQVGYRVEIARDPLVIAVAATVVVNLALLETDRRHTTTTPQQHHSNKSAAHCSKHVGAMACNAVVDPPPSPW